MGYKALQIAKVYRIRGQRGTTKPYEPGVKYYSRSAKWAKHDRNRRIRHTPAWELPNMGYSNYAD